MCDQQRPPDNSFTGAMIFFGALNAFFIRIQNVNQMSPNDGTPQNSTSMTWK
jgi:hypothetical protein